MQAQQKPIENLNAEELTAEVTGEDMIECLRIIFEHETASPENSSPFVEALANLKFCIPGFDYRISVDQKNYITGIAYLTVTCIASNFF